MRWSSSQQHTRTKSTYCRQISIHSAKAQGEDSPRMAFLTVTERQVRNEIDLASSEGLDGMKVDNTKPRGPFVCPAGHGMNRAGVKPARTISTSCRKSSTRKWRNFTFQQVLISKGEYDEFCPTIVHRKCFLARRVGCTHFSL